MEVKSNFYLPRPLALILTGVFMSIILYTSTVPSPKVDVSSQSFVDHALDFAHFPVYIVLTFLLWAVFASAKFRYQIIVFAIAFFFGVFNEFVQLHVPGRSFSIKDMAVNALGAIFMIGCLNYLRKKSA